MSDVQSTPRVHPPPPPPTPHRSTLRSLYFCPGRASLPSPPTCLEPLGPQAPCQMSPCSTSSVVTPDFRGLPGPKAERTH